LLRIFRALILPSDKGLVDFWTFWTTIANQGIVADWLVPCVFKEVKTILWKGGIMALQMNRSDRWQKWLGSRGEARAAVLNVLRHRYIRESQHAMRYRQHAEKIHYPEFREALISIAAEEEKHAEWIGAKIKDLGEKVPDVIPIHVAKEQNSWFYLRTDLEEEERCAEEWQHDLPALSGEFPEVTEMLQRIDSDCKRHWLRFRWMLAHSDPLSEGPA
jgi:rubrerythrin